MEQDKKKVTDTNVKKFFSLKCPLELKKEIPICDKTVKTVLDTRKEITDILLGKDTRKIIIVGPCSIHDADAALDYAMRLKELKEEVKSKFLIVMRAYFEKPRTTIGWKGLINDPHLNNSFDINFGLHKARKILQSITNLGLGVGTESLEPISPQFLSDFISWTSIGARTTESQTHREMASGLSSPVGFKNNTDGNMTVAINAIKSAQNPHCFLGIDEKGITSIVHTKGNKYAHLVLRGGKDSPNYDKSSVSKAAELLKKNGLLSSLIIDCSHDNSRKDYKNQPLVFMNIIEQINEGDKNIKGLMIESNIHEGNQALGDNLKYGVSITDGCISFNETHNLICEAFKILQN